jgi:DNA repair protein RadA
VIHMPSRLKQVTMEHIPHITSDIIEKLRKLNINSVYQLAVQNPFELALEHEDSSLDAESASILIANARKILRENQVLINEFSTADEVLEKRNNMSRFATGSESFDNFLSGGFETQAITELVGEFGSGKSQICHTLCVAANQLIKNDRHNDVRENNNKQSATGTGNIIFIDSENTFRADRDQNALKK